MRPSRTPTWRPQPVLRVARDRDHLAVLGLHDDAAAAAAEAAHALVPRDALFGLAGAGGLNGRDGNADRYGGACGEAGLDEGAALLVDLMD